MKVTKEDEFFSKITTVNQNIDIILVTHLLPDRPAFLKALSKIGKVVAIIPKPKSINKETLHIIKKRYPIINFTREDMNNSKKIIRFIKKVTKRKFIILDIGGYFSYTFNDIAKHFGDKFIGVVEDTENGVQKYESLKELKKPIFSVARSPLKYAEDILVAYSTVYSADTILRERNEIVGGKKAGVIGFGKIGQHIARELEAKRARVQVYDKDQVKLVQAAAEGFDIENKKRLLNNSQLIFCVTGKQALNNKDLEKLRGEKYIFSITSSDDEFNFNNNFRKHKIELNSFGTTLVNSRNKIHLVNNGNAVNFLHDAVIGNFIYLVQAEIITCALKLLAKEYSNKIHELESKDWQKIGANWIKVFETKFPKWKHF